MAISQPSYKSNKAYYPRIIRAMFGSLLLLAASVLLYQFNDNSSFETTYAKISGFWPAIISWLYIIARGISFPSYLARLKDYWTKPEHRVEKWGIIFGIIATTILTILFFSYKMAFATFTPLSSIASGILFSFFFASQFIGLIPRLCRSFDAPINTAIYAINLKNENLAIILSAIAAIIFIAVVGITSISAFSSGPAGLVAIYSIFSLCAMTVSTSSYIGRCIDLITTRTLFDCLSNSHHNKTAKKPWNAESKGMFIGMVLGPGIGAILVWVVAITIPLSGGLSTPLAITLFLFGNIGVGGAFGARMGVMIDWCINGDTASESPVSSCAEPLTDNTPKNSNPYRQLTSSSEDDTSVVTNIGFPKRGSATPIPHGKQAAIISPAIITVTNNTPSPSQFSTQPHQTYNRI